MKKAGFVCTEPCGRQWFVPLSKVLEDYVVYLVDADGIDRATAEKQAGKDYDFAKTWFREQYIWSEVIRDGVMLRDSDPVKVRAVLDAYRGADDSPCDASELCAAQPEAH